jgi:hypothetical protein
MPSYRIERRFLARSSQNNVRGAVSRPGAAWAPLGETVAVTGRNQQYMRCGISAWLCSVAMAAPAASRRAAKEKRAHNSA